MREGDKRRVSREENGAVPQRIGTAAPVPAGNRTDGWT